MLVSNWGSIVCVFVVTILLFTAGVFSYATEPTQDAPLGNTDQVIHVGGSSQTKTGGLGVGSLVSDGAIQIGSSTALCSETVAGSVQFSSGELYACTEGIDGYEWLLVGVLGTHLPQSCAQGEGVKYASAIDSWVCETTETVNEQAEVAGPPEYLQKQVFSYTGSDQQFTIPLDATYVKIKAWGGGGIGFNNWGGAGGYSEGEFDLSSGPILPGDVVSIVAGKASNYVWSGCQNTYGFGSGAMCYSSGNSQFDSGAGLSGVFMGNSAVSASDQSRALVVAGGGGGMGKTGYGGAAAAVGGPGNHPSYSGGQSATMQGLAGYGSNGGSGRAGGGGGYEGGSSYSPGYPTAGQVGAQGGSGYVHPSAASSSIQYVEIGTVQTAPNQDDEDYISPAAKSQSYTSQHGHGLVVILWAVD